MDAPTAPWGSGAADRRRLLIIGIRINLEKVSVDHRI
jgi:hypothetical protein